MSRHNNANPVDAVPVKRLAFNPATGTHETCPSTAKFIKGPIPLDWISRANALPGKAGAVGMALWFLAGVQKRSTVKLTGEVEKIAGCGSKVVYRALRLMSDANLLVSTQPTGARATITILA